MTEAEWLATAPVQAKLDYVRQRSFSDQRKLGLLALGVCRLTWHLLLDKRSRQAVESMEDIWDMPNPRRVPQTVIRSGLRGSKWSAQFGTLAEVAATTVNQALTLYPSGQIGYVLIQVSTALAESESQASRDVLVRPLLDCIFGNPFRPAAFSLEWRTDTVLSLARGMYESRDFGAMPILADALQDAGCDSDDVLDHCRGPGPHVRGCWVVDLVLGKE